MTDKKNKKTALLKSFIPYYKKYRGILALDLLCAALTVVSELVFPLIVRKFTDTAVENVALLTYKLIFTLGGIYIGLKLIETVANYFMQSVGHIMGAKIETDMRRDLFDQYQRLSFSYYATAKVGQLMSRMTSDLFDITEFSHHCPEEYFIAGIKIIAAFVILCTFNVWLTLIIFAMIPLMILCSRVYAKRMYNAFVKQRNQIGEVNANVEDTLLGIRVVKSFTAEKQEAEKFKRGNNTFLNIKKNMYHNMAGFHSVTRLFDGLMYIVVIVVGAVFLKNKALSLGDYTAYLLFVNTLLLSIRKIVEYTEQLSRGLTGIARFKSVMDVEPEIKDVDNAIELGNARGEIKFEGVSFSYDDGKAEVLRNVNLNIAEGEHIALVGPSGGGKSTLINLIPRFYDVIDGVITVDGIDISKVSQRSLRKNIGIVQQDVYLFSGTVYDNISYALPGADRSKIIQAACLAGADEFIRELPNGYDTHIGERGVKLSGGQKQRISIARVFLKNPPILLLDEATSALDNASENIVQHSLKKLAENRTTITIAHRLSTIRDSDRIYVITPNGIDECGTHDELMEKKGVYYNLYRINRAQR